MAEPIVEHRGHKRAAKGYSIPEVVEAGLRINDIMKHRIRIDPRRKSKYAANVDLLKKRTQ